MSVGGWRGGDSLSETTIRRPWIASDRSHRRPSSSLLFSLTSFALLISSTDAFAQRAAPVEELRIVEEERGRVEFLLRRLHEKEAKVLEILEEAEQDMLEAREQARQSQQRREEAERTLHEAQTVASQLELQREELARAVGPRLLLRYRLGTHTDLRAFFDAPTLSDYLWRRRMVDRLLAGDLELAQRLEALEVEARQAAERVETERVALVEAEKEAQRRAREASLRRQAQQALLAAARTEHAIHQRAINELERSRRQLLSEIAEMPSTPQGLGGFSGRRGRLPFPVKGTVEVEFGRRMDPRFRTVTHHNGMDIRARAGTPVRVPHSAVVGFAGPFRGYGNLVVLDHGEGYYTLYAHLDQVLVERGNRVREGDPLGTVGESGSLKGPYLYFEIRSGQKPLDPSEWLVRE